MKTVTTLGRNGVQDWLWQRISAIFILAYFLYLNYFLLSHKNLDYKTWHNLFANNWMKIFSLFFLLNFVIHAWIGLWTVATDYIKHSFLRLVFEIAVIFVALGTSVWGTIILWSY